MNINKYKQTHRTNSHMYRIFVLICIEYLIVYTARQRCPCFCFSNLFPIVKTFDAATDSPRVVWVHLIFFLAAAAAASWLPDWGSDCDCEAEAARQRQLSWQSVERRVSCTEDSWVRPSRLHVAPASCFQTDATTALAAASLLSSTSTSASLSQQVNVNININIKLSQLTWL